ncbi:MAG: M28 family peptidase [Oscillatoria sp. SIO1A7]|nr:M28 family peptidase [Oscillatoria sp. SIO1A7]
MRKKIWLGLLAVLGVVGAIALGYYFQPSASVRSVASTAPGTVVRNPVSDLKLETKETETNPGFPKNRVSSELAAVAPASEVSPERLMADVEALAFERYNDRDRSKARDYIAEQLRAAGWEPKQQEFEGGVNLYADRPGSDPEAGTILVAAHYDTVALSPGADDNATGVATVLEVARLLGDRPTPRSLRVAFFDLEEIGLLGSIAFAGDEQLRQDLEGVIVLDMVGYGCYIPGCQKYPSGLAIAKPSDKGDFLAAIGDAEHMPLLDAFEPKVRTQTGAQTGENQNSDSSSVLRPALTPVFSFAVPLGGVLTPNLMRSDHAPFWYWGIGAVLLTDTANFRSPYYHEPSDIPANIDRPFFIGSARTTVNAVSRLLESRESLASPPASPNSKY